MPSLEISIIIPHYNAVRQIRELLSDIPSDPRLEVIVVDDRSTEDIGELRGLLREPGRTLLLNDRPSKGAGTARNIGVENARGKWLVFADADDRFTEGWDSIVLSYVDSGYDEVFFAPTSRNAVTGEPGARHRHYEELVKRHSAVGSEKTETELRYGFYTPWSRMVRKDVFTDHGIRFDEQLVANDVMAMTRCAFFARTVFADPRTVYCVTCGEGTLTGNQRKDDFETRIDTKIRRYRFLRDNLPEKQFAWTHADYHMAGSLADAALSGQDVKQLIRKYRENGVPVVSLRMLEPSFFLRHFTSDLRWRREVNG